MEKQDLTYLNWIKIRNSSGIDLGYDLNTVVAI